MSPYYEDMAIKLYLGDWRDVLPHVGGTGGVRVDHVITDTPYSDRVERGFRSGSDVGKACGMGYEPIDEAWVGVAMATWPLNGWLVVCGDHITTRWWEAAAESAGRYVFPPLPIVKRGAGPRMAGDGPASQSEWIAVSRPREARFMGWGSLPGWYEMQTVRALNGYVGVRGAKSLAFMRAIVRDYSRPGDTILDPCAGGGTTGLAARLEGRKCILIERDPKTAEIAARRLDVAHSGRMNDKQGELFGEERRRV